MIKVQNITKVFYLGDTKLIALNNISFEVPTGQFLAITGMSGSGKSTLLYQLSLLDHPTEGKVILDNKDMTAFNSKERISYRLNNLGYIFQDYAILPSLTAKENVMIPLLMQGISEDIAMKLAEKSLQKVDLYARSNNLPSQLSGGQQQRVSIARAIVHGPKIVFADEPTANLDTKSSKKVLEIFLSLRSLGQTIVMVTHEPEYAKLADRIIELRDGIIISDKLSKTKSK